MQAVVPAAEHRALRPARCKHYAHFTSPIRRYPDLVVHRCLRAHAVGLDPYGMRYDGGQLALGRRRAHGSSRSAPTNRIATSTRGSSACTCAIASARRFEGLITTVVEFGAFVQLTAVGVDGLLHIDNLRDDEYVMEPGGRAWVGRTNKRRLSHRRARARHRDQRESHRGPRGPVARRRWTRPGSIGLQKSPHRARPSREARAVR